MNNNNNDDNLPVGDGDEPVAAEAGPPEEEDDESDAADDDREMEEPQFDADDDPLEELPQETRDLHEACRAGDLEQVQELVLQQGVDVNCRNDLEFPLHEMPLHVAVRAGHLSITSWLLDNGAGHHIHATVQTTGDHNFRILTPLHMACEEGNLEIVKLLIQRYAYRDKQDNRGWTPFHTACYSGHADIIQWLLDQEKSYVNLPTGIGEDGVQNVTTPLHLACLGKKDASGEKEAGHHDVVKLLVSNGADVHSADSDYGDTPLHKACRIRSPCLDTVNLLLDHTGIHAKNGKQKTVLHLALCETNPSVGFIELLLKSGANPNEKDMMGNTSLHLAVHSYTPGILGLLVQYGADGWKMKNKDGLTPLQSAIQWGGSNDFLSDGGSGGSVITDWTAGDQEFVDVNQKDEDTGETLIFFACKGNHLETAKWLVEKGAKVNVKDNEGKTPLHHVCSRKFFGEAEWLVRWLVEEHKVGVNTPDMEGWCPLHHAVQSLENSLADFDFDVLSIIRFLVDSGADTNTPTNQGQTPLHIASSIKSTIQDEVCECLIENHANVDCTDNKGWTPLHYAVQNVGNRSYLRTNALRLLVAHGSDVNAQDSQGQSPFLLACLLPNMNVVSSVRQAGRRILTSKVENSELAQMAVELLIENQADFTVPNHKGQTPLHAVCGLNHPGRAEWLLEGREGALNFFAINREDGMTPIATAAKAGHTDLVRKLVEHSLLTQEQKSRSNKRKQNEM